MESLVAGVGPWAERHIDGVAARYRMRGSLSHVHTTQPSLRGPFQQSTAAKESTTAGFEPARAMPNRFRVYRLNRSATL